MSTARTRVPSLSLATDTSCAGCCGSAPPPIWTYGGSGGCGAGAAVVSPFARAVADDRMPATTSGATLRRRAMRRGRARRVPPAAGPLFAPFAARRRVGHRVEGRDPCARSGARVAGRRRSSAGTVGVRARRGRVRDRRRLRGACRQSDRGPDERPGVGVDVRSRRRPSARRRGDGGDRSGRPARPARAASSARLRAGMGETLERLGDFPHRLAADP